MEDQDRLSRSLQPRAWGERRPGVVVASRTPQRLGVALAGATLLSGCLMGDPPPDPEVQPLEIVAGNPDPEYGPCFPNMNEVGAGAHEVWPMSMGGQATVRIVDPSGAVIFELAIQSHALEGGGHESMPGDGGSVRLGAGNHRVECILSGGAHTTELLVVPARPGYEEGGTG